MSMMNYTKKTLEMTSKNNGYITSLQVTNEHIPRVYLKLLVDSGLLEQSARGV